MPERMLLISGMPDPTAYGLMKDTYIQVNEFRIVQARAKGFVGAKSEREGMQDTHAAAMNARKTLYAMYSNMLRK